MLLLLLLPGSALLLLGLIFKTWPPKKINWLYGYRTKASMRDLDTWREGNRYSTKLIIQIGLLMFVLGVACFYLFHFLLGLLLLIGLMLVLLIVSLLLTERHLKRKFYRD